MGNCAAKEVVSQNDYVEYFKSITLQVGERNNAGKIIARSPLSFEATSPICLNEDVFVLGKNIRVFGCVLPGLDPYGNEKKCQDNYSYLFIDDMLLCGLFDGHGPVGEQVSAYSAEYIKTYFRENLREFSSNPKESLIQMLEKCDASLKDTKINYELSGTTAVVLLITKTSLHTASLGDSRAILATLSENEIELPRPLNKFCRNWTVLKKLKAIALTNDQKPNHEEEFLRIREAGGRVERLTDVMGNCLGPYRVWEADNDKPGLAMSRSIGDNVGKKIGVISTPVYHKFTLYPESDQFIVMGSDGIWDVMENSEVINFVEKFKERCDLSMNTDLYPAATQNSSISRILCEEARYRWYGLIESEDVNIDDISCIIIDISGKNNESRISKDARRIQAFQSIAIPTSSIEDID